MGTQARTQRMQMLKVNRQDHFPHAVFVRLSSAMNHLYSTLAAIALYLSATGLIGWRLLGRDRPNPPPRILALWLVLAGLMLHAWVLYDSIFSHPGLNLAFFNALVLTSWTVIALFFVSSLTKPVENLGLVLLPVAALTLLLEASFPGPEFMRPAVGWDIKIHVLISMLAYSLLTLASVQAILLAVQDHHLPGATWPVSSVPCPHSRRWKVCFSR